MSMVKKKKKYKKKIIYLVQEFLFPFRKQLMFCASLRDGMF